MGNIGKNVARIFRGAFESPVIAYEPCLPNDAWQEIPHHRAASMEEVFMSADIITLHIPLTEAKRGLVSYAQMQQMKRSAIVINTARGGIVDERDFERALKDGLIWGAGLDCHEQEPPTKKRYGTLWDLGVCQHSTHRSCHRTDTR
jgi:phosphoglycerate dehydrogenase-like enzyme